MSSTDFFSKLLFFKKKNAFRDTIRMSNDFDPDMGLNDFDPDMGLNCLKR